MEIGSKVRFERRGHIVSGILVDIGTPMCPRTPTVLVLHPHTSGAKSERVEVKMCEMWVVR